MKKYKKLEYYKNCIDFGTDNGANDVDHLLTMIDNEVDVSWETFKKHVDLDQVRDLFPNYYWRGYNKKSDVGDLTLWNDWAVTFHRSKLYGETVYFIRHSAIEYIFSVYGAYKTLEVI